MPPRFKPPSASVAEIDLRPRSEVSDIHLLRAVHFWQRPEGRRHIQKAAFFVGSVTLGFGVGAAWLSVGASLTGLIVTSVLPMLFLFAFFRA